MSRHEARWTDEVEAWADDEADTAPELTGDLDADWRAVRAWLAAEQAKARRAELERGDR